MIVKINGPIEELVNVWEQLLIRFIEGENDVVIEIDESNSVGGQAICEDRKYLARTGKVASGLHLIEGSPPGSNEVVRTNASSCWKTFKVTKARLNNHYG